MESIVISLIFWESGTSSKTLAKFLVLYYLQKWIWFLKWFSSYKRAYNWRLSVSNLFLPYSSSFFWEFNKFWILRFWSRIFIIFKIFAWLNSLKVWTLPSGFSWKSWSEIFDSAGRLFLSFTSSSKEFLSRLNSLTGWDLIFC